MITLRRWLCILPAMALLAVVGTAASVSGVEAATSPAPQAAELMTCPDPESGDDRAYPELVAEAQPDAYWRLGEKEGTQLLDSSGRDQHGTYLGGFATLGVPGALRGAGAGESENTAVRFDGGYAEVPSSDTVSPDGAYTVEAWVRAERLLGGDGQGIVEKYSAPANLGFALRLDGAGRVQAFNLGASGSAAVTGATVVSTGSWHHVAVTYDGAELAVFLDGSLDASASTSVAPATGPATLKIGARGDDAAQRWPGALDEVALYSRALSAEDVAAHHRAGVQGPPAVYSRPGNGNFAHSTFGPHWLGEAFTAQGTLISRVATWMTVPTDAPIQADIIEGTDPQGPVVGSTQLAAGVQGKVDADLATPIQVTPGAPYILKISSPESTQGQVEQQDDAPGGAFFEGGVSPIGINMALEVEYCQSTLTTAQRLPVDDDFGPVHSGALAGESFSALDGSVANVSVWMREANDGPLTVNVHRDAPDGPVIGSARLFAGPEGKRTISFEPPVPVDPDGHYAVTVAAGEAGTTSGSVARSESDPDSQGYNDAGPSDLDMALQLDFGPPVIDDLGPADCSEQLELDPAYVESVNAALRSGPDVWGNELMARPEGPTYENIKGYLKPLMLVGQPAGNGGNQLTDSGVYYVPMGTPGGADGSGGPMALHVADGSQIVSHRADGRKATFYVGAEGRERYGLCLATLSEPQLDDGLPVLTTRYQDIDGVEYTQESFVGRIPSSASLASYVRITVDRGDSAVEAVQLRTALTDGRLQRDGGRLVRDGETYLAFSTGGEIVDGDLQHRLDLTDTQPDVVHLVRPIDPVETTTLTADNASFDAARAASNNAWTQRLGEGATYEVPEQAVMDAQRNLLVQNLQLGWRYSWGNQYETHFPEGNHAQVTMAEYGFQQDARAGLQTLLGLTHNRSLHWERSAKLLSAAQYFLLTGDREYIADNTPQLSGYLDEMTRERAADPNGLLPKDELSHDISTKMYGTHVQSMGWRAFRDMATVWRMIGRDDLADRYQADAEQFGAALRAAIDSSAIKVTDDQTFIPVALLAGEQPWSPITDTKLGSYWNLVMPYVYASGILGDELEQQALEYARQHGSFLLGMQRFNYYPTAIGEVTPGGLPGYRTSGVDNQYGVSSTELLADLDKPDDIVLALYGKLVHGMTRGTFISGEGETVGPVDGEYYRSIYLPPASFNNDYFLTVLRRMLIHVTETDASPDGLRLAFSTPRGWLEDGKQISVSDAPTPFGDLAYAIRSHTDDGYVDVDLQIPNERPISDLQLRLRLPAGLKISEVQVVGAPDQQVPFEGDTLTLTGMTDHVQLRVLVGDPQPPACPEPDTRETVVVGDVDSGVPNRTTPDGCTINDLIRDEDPWPSKGAFVRHVNEVLEPLVETGLITEREQGAIVRAATRSNVGRAG